MIQFVIGAAVLIIASVLLALCWTGVKRILEYVFFFLGLAIMMVMWLGSIIYATGTKLWYTFRQGW